MARGGAASEIWSVSLGMMLIATSGVANSMMFTLLPVMQRRGLPFYFSVGTAQLLLSAAMAAAVWRSGQLASVEASKWKWVFLRGVTGGLLGVFGVWAVACGARLGDVSSLQCINAVVAAILGRAFLGEQTRSLHIVAIGLSLVGAVLVTESYTVFLPGPGGGPPPPWAGYALACASGAMSGLTFVAGRKSKGVNVLVMSTSVCLHEGGIMLLMPCFGLVRDAPLDVVWRSPWAVLGFFALGGGFFCITVMSLNSGAERCPAAAGSTIFSSASMTTAYAGQVVVLGQVPRALTLFGAALMLLSVAVMAMAGMWYTRKDARTAGCMELCGGPAAVQVARKALEAPLESLESPDVKHVVGMEDRM
uniref:EamA domain-containing protein n=1 Tax=Zooxanthella nutricula TaxID=1333877 RepID=A0A7S2JCR2_9DINO